MLIQKYQPCYSDGSQMSPGDEPEVSCADIRPIPHRGLIYRLLEGPADVIDVQIVHNSKRCGVCVVSWQDFAQGEQVRLRRRPASIEHARLIVELAETRIGHPYHALAANCEHFTDFCFNGIEGESTTLHTAALVGLGVVALFTLAVDRS